MWLRGSLRFYPLSWVVVYVYGVKGGRLWVWRFRGAGRVRVYLVAVRASGALACIRY